MAQSSASAGVDTSAYAQINESSQMFIIDDILAWFWCSITKCKTKEEAPAKAEPKKQPEVEVKKKEAKEEAPSNKSNSSNSTNSTKDSDSSSTTPATPASKPSSTPSRAPTGAGANAGSGENNDLTPREDTLETIKRLKAKQDAKQGTDNIGGKEARNADEVTKTKKDMAAGPPNEFKDEPPSISQKKATSSSVQKN